VEAVGPARDTLDACLIFPSMPAVMKLNKLGTFSMSQLGQGKSAIGEFMKNARKQNDNFEESLLKLVRGAGGISRNLGGVGESVVCWQIPHGCLEPAGLGWTGWGCGGRAGARPGVLFCAGHAP
jgi:hypothetical protein